MEKPATLPLTDADWQQTPIASQVLIVTLWDEVQQLRSEVASLREQVQQTSYNSSRPPSSDPPQLIRVRTSKATAGARRRYNL